MLGYIYLLLVNAQCGWDMFGSTILNLNICTELTYKSTVAVDTTVLDKPLHLFRVILKYCWHIPEFFYLHIINVACKTRQFHEIVYMSNKIK